MIRKLKNLGHLVEALAAISYYRSPSKKLKVIGVTGTDGKTTTTSLIYHILRTAGKKVSMISTVYAKVGDKEFDTGLHTTTPHSFQIQKLLKKAVDEGEEYMVLETTSHAIDQNRVYGVRYEVGVITNVTHEHLDYHGSYDNYLRTKAKLLLDAKTAIINRDDISYTQLNAILSSHHKASLTYGLENPADYQIEIAKKINRDLAEFNRYNYLAAYAVCTTLGLEENIIFEAMKTFKLPPGRMDLIYDKNFKVLVDFAHTPHAIDEALKAVRDHVVTHGGRIIHVFSSAGLRDNTKRPLMGEASGNYADLTILTEEDYRTEDPIKIDEQIAEGLKKKGFSYVVPEKFDGNDNKEYTIITSREEAIKKALTIVKDNDVIVLTGKGHEQSLCRGKIEYPWSDKEETIKLIGGRL